ncbi:8-amino-7-oxononanoate synthase [Aureibaculum sp. 2210JD6-5]|uniref:aminotransferase class I/II-fold pyridoxal phosphate-dependent enzyme n=1 Tax=Aureibaculum sp. 2210JD6-5 TaxID=3103957 RepID=UPI002AAC4FC2|nr:8-amino-7-oxononanoate synthase [Aureibaculum sp. 2210JD6-5]MDY7395455.1 8-amino-7-oxononanoate synthase [Aureibaculum sp. 2210JD6-5]
MELPNKLLSKLKNRKTSNALRSLDTENNLIDFSSNDYLGFSKSAKIFETTHQYLIDNQILQNGSTGSRLLSGNHKLYLEVEEKLSKFHKSDTALIFNSGYDANVGFFASVPQRGDVILYDELIHASIRDGITMSNAKSYKFKHNDLNDLIDLLERHSESDQDNSIFIVTESVFSMDGDSPDLTRMAQVCQKYNAYFIIDEAHAVGVFGQQGCGETQRVGLEDRVFARIITFGKALGCHGAAILGSEDLKDYLINFARSFIYTTALPPHSLATIKEAYGQLVSSNGAENSAKLRANIQNFKYEVIKLNLQDQFIESNSAIHSCIIPGNEKVKSIAQQLQLKGFDVKPILSPTVPEGEERLRFCLHSYNSTKEITEMLTLLKNFID